MLIGAAFAELDSDFYYFYNEKDFRVRSRNAIESSRCIRSIAKALDLSLKISEEIPKSFSFKKGDLADPYLLGTRIYPLEGYYPDLIGWNADLYLKFSGHLRISNPLKSFKVINSWKNANCFNFYENLAVHPAISENLLPISNKRTITQTRWKNLIRDLLSNAEFKQEYFSQYNKNEITLLIFPHLTSDRVNLSILEIARELVISKQIKQVVLKVHPNYVLNFEGFFTLERLPGVIVKEFKPKEFPAELLTHYFSNSYTLGIPTGAHVEKNPTESYIIDCTEDTQAKLWPLYYSKFYTLTGHKIESKDKLLSRH